MGALVVALVNDETSPLAEQADVTLPLCAGPETSVAATKSYIVSLAGLAALVGAWSGDVGLQAGCRALVHGLPQAFASDWSAAVPDLAGAPSLFTIGRGYTFAIAQEAALKLKETCGLHGEAFSSAEVRHGPMAIVRDGFPVLAFAGSDAAGDDVRKVCGEFAARGARVWLASAAADVPPGVNALPLPAAAPEFAPMLAISAFYRMVDQLALARGFDPDAPPFLSKVTRTV
jgi:glucosamine--fructose-6-phosphate aminotransferase (isomerizing)